jgi:hypothetical protein
MFNPQLITGLRRFLSAYTSISTNTQQRKSSHAMWLLISVRDVAITSQNILA